MSPRAIACAGATCVALALLGALTWAGACTPQVDYTGSRFVCGDNDRCPAGFTCLAGTCNPDDEVDLDARAAADAVGIDAATSSGGLPPAVVGTTSAIGNGGAVLHIPVPFGIQVGDLVIVQCSQVSPDAFAVLPSGFSHLEGSPRENLDQQGVAESHVATMYKVITNPEVEPETYECESRDPWNSGGFATAIRGAGEIDDSAFVVTDDPVASATPDSPAVVTSGPNRLLVLTQHLCGSVDTVVTPPFGSIGFVGVNKYCAHHGVAFLEQAEAGSTGEFLWENQSASASYSLAGTLAIAPDR